MHLKKLSYAFVTASAITASAPVFADTWTVDPAQSSLGFEVQQAGQPLKGTFTSWTANIDFDTDNPGASKISAEIEPASASTGNPQFDSTLPAPDWFDASGFPKAEFTADSVSHVDGNVYKADGTLTIKGISQPVTLDFTLDITGDTAQAKGTASLNRLDYKLGSSVGKDTVGDAVTVTLDLTATR